MIALSAAVAEAIDAVREQFADTTVDVVPDGAGGAYIVVESIDVAPLYDPPTTWLGFHLNAAYPASDVYPHYTGLLTRTDSQPHGSAIQSVSWRDRPALQLSRRSKRWNPAVDNAALKAQKVLTWLTSQ